MQFDQSKSDAIERTQIAKNFDTAAAKSPETAKMAEMVKSAETAKVRDFVKSAMEKVAESAPQPAKGQEAATKGQEMAKLTEFQPLAPPTLNLPSVAVSSAPVQPGDVISSALMNQVLARLDELDRRTLAVRIVPSPLVTGSHGLVALGGAFGQPGGIWLDDTSLLPAIPSPGINVVILSGYNLSVKYWSVYATASVAAESDRLAGDLQANAGGSDLVVAVTQDAFADHLQPSAKGTLAAIGGAAFSTALPNRDAIAFIGVVPATGSLNFNYLVSDVPVDGQGAGLPFVWAVYSMPLRRFLVGGGAGQVSASAGTPLTITSLRFEPAQPTVGASATGTLTLSGEAPSAITVALSSGNTAVASLPQAAVQIPQGKTSTTFPVTAVAPGQVSISASLAGQAAFSVSLGVQPPPATLSVIQVSLDPVTAAPGATVTGTVALSDKATAGTTVGLSSGNTQVATLPQPSVAVPVGQTSATFQVTTVNAGTTDIRATLGQSSQMASLTVQKPKESKEGKERKENKETKETKDKDTKETSKEREKLQVEKFNQLEKSRDFVQQQAGEPLRASAPTASSGAAAVPAPTGQAFIRADERPAVGTKALSEPVGVG